MKIAFFSPYLPKHTGGGEKYLFDCAQILLEAGHQVFMAISSPQPLTSEEVEQIRSKYSRFLNADLSKLNFIACPIYTSAGFFKKLWWTKQFDVLYYQTDGSLFFSLAKKNILHIQVPLPIQKKTLLERLKLKNWQVKNSNSEFTKFYIEKFWQTNIDYVHQPYVAAAEFSAQLKKEKIILSVGRFFCQLHSKRQDILVEFFKDLLNREPKLSQGWKLVLLGKKEDAEFAKKIADSIGDLPVEIYHHLDRAALIDFYQKASLYWHAAGFGIDENSHPEKVEHFGIATLEAMAAGAVPVVINKGGQKEILGSELADCLWESQADCLAKTIDLMQDANKLQRLSKLAKQRSLLFNKEKFKKILLKMIS